MLLSKTDLLTEDGALYETHLDVMPDSFCTYQVRQSTNNMPSISRGVETVFLNREQAVSIAKTILLHEGYTIAKNQPNETVHQGPTPINPDPVQG